MPTTTAPDGTALFCTDWGHGRPVVLLHGWALDQRMWEGQVADLVAAGHRCVTYDRRGHGRSDVPSRGYGYDALAADLAAVLAQRDLSDVLLVTHSMAAGDAVRCLSSGLDEGRVSGLVLVGCTTPCLPAGPDNPHGVPPALLAASAAQLAEDRPAWFLAGAGAYFARPEAAPLTPQGQVTLDMCLQTPLPVLQAGMATMATADLRDDVRRVGVPTLVVHGDADASAPLALTAEPTAALLPRGRLVVYPGAPHGLYVTERARLSRDVLAFAQETARTAVPA